jgi:hypothetical protein
LGFNSLRSNTTGNNNTAHGAFSLYSNSTGFFNTASGYQALNNNSTGYRNTGIGALALTSNSVGYENTAIGYISLASNTTGYNNTASGQAAMYSNTTGIKNTAHGMEALYSNTIGEWNSATGYQAMKSNIGGGANVANGFQALYLNNGSYNTAIGVQALYSNTSAIANTAVGHAALTSSSTGSNNTAVGQGALFTLTSGSNNTAVGKGAGSSTPGNVNNVTLLGVNAGFVTTPDNHINIGNTSNVWIGGQVNWGVWSDERIKKDVKDNVPGLAFIMKLKPVTYHLDIHSQNEMVYARGSDTLSWPGKYEIETITQTGFIAQDVEKAAKQSNYNFSGVAAPATMEGLYSIRYAEFVVPLVKAVQELNIKFEAQEKANLELKQANEELRIQIEQLKQKTDKPGN